MVSTTIWAIQQCWKDTKPNYIANNYLEVLVNDETTTLEQFSHLCGTKHDLLWHQDTKIENANRNENVRGGKSKGKNHGWYVTTSAMKERSSRSKILTHFIKNKISLSLMETILSILGKLEYLESLMKLAQKKKYESFKIVNMMKPKKTPTI